MQPSEPMTGEERLRAAIELQEPDRPPISPLIYFFAARHAGITIERFLSSPQAAFEAIVQTFEELGGWDVQFGAGGYDPLLYAFEVPIKLKLPGKELPPESIWQADEQEVMLADEYDVIIEKGWTRYFLGTLLPRIRPGHGGSLQGYARLLYRTAAITLRARKDFGYWRKRGIPVLVGSGCAVPFETLSAARSFTKFFRDVFKQPEKVKAAMDAILPDLIRDTLAIVKLMGVPRVSVGATRASGQFISPRHFEEFFFPWLKQIVEAFHAEGVTSLLHFDSDWTKNLPYFRDLPRGSCILELDSTTDIFEAKKVLGDHLCLMGDVPGTLLKLGTPEEVAEYSLKLLDVVGAGGGFVFSSGCEVPHDAKFENVKAMLDTAKTYSAPGR